MKTHHTNICFLSNFTKTYFFHELAKDMDKAGFKTYWIATNQKLYAFLQEHYEPERILYLNRDFMEGNGASVQDFKLNELIYGDRVLHHEPEKGLQFLRNIQAPIYDFFRNNKVSFVYGEVTWAHEVLVHRMVEKCTELNCQFLNPHVVRIPSSRFTFFTNERQSELLETWQNDAWDGKMLEVKKPDYLKINDKRLKKANTIMGRLDKVKRFLSNENIDKKDPTLIVNEKIRFRVRTREELNKELYKRIKRVDFEDFKEVPYLFVGLHKQPEASVDVFGRYYEDQLQNIQNLWRALPEGWNLLVKEHTNAIGDRSPEFYKKLLELPNLHFVHESTDSYQLIRNAALVATITGTIGLEAALMQVPAVTFAPVFFNRLNYCRQISLEDLDKNNLAELANELRHAEDNRLEFSEFIFRNSYVGSVLDPISRKEVMVPENVSRVSQAFQMAIEKCMMVF